MQKVDAKYEWLITLLEEYSQAHGLQTNEVLEKWKQNGTVDMILNNFATDHVRGHQFTLDKIT
jgi:hypothetical protein